MDDKYKFSIIIPTFNRSKLIQECINSVLLQDFNDYEIVIVDDGSEDDTNFKFINNNRENLFYFRLEKNRGVNFARNFGIQKAKGSYIIFLDSDDLFTDNALSVINSYVNNFKDVNHFLFQIYNVDKYKFESHVYSNFKDWLSEKYSGDFTHVIKRELLIQFPFFEQFKASEYLNWFRIYKKDQPQIIIKKKIVNIRSNRNESLMYQLKLINRERIFEQYLSNNEFISLYFEDYKQNCIDKINKIIVKNFFLGLALQKYGENQKLILKYSGSKYKCLLLKFLNTIKLGKFVYLSIIIKAIITDLKTK